MKNDLEKSLSRELEMALAAGDKDQGVGVARKALEAGLSPSKLFLDLVQPQLYQIGEKFERLEVFLPDLMKAANVVLEMQEQVLEPAILQNDEESTQLGTVVLGTVQSDIHDIGKNMVGLMLQVNGFKVIDLGTDTKITDFIQAAKENQADIIGASSLLTPSMPYMEDLISRVHDLGLAEQFKIIVGGAPVTEAYAADIGADAYGADAVTAVKMCRELVGKKEQ